MTKRVAIYARVSTDQQTTDNQIIQLKTVADRQGWIVSAEFVDEGISGSKGRDKRPQFDSLLKGAVRKDFDLVMSWSVDRLGRSLQHLVEFLNELHSVGCDLYLHQQALNTTTPAGKAMFQMCGVFAEMERSLIQERVRAGLERAKAKGTRLGRPGLSDEVKDRIRDLRSTGLSMGKVASELGVSVGVVHKVVNA